MMLISILPLIAPFNVKQASVFLLACLDSTRKEMAYSASNLSTKPEITILSHILAQISIMLYHNSLLW